MGSYLGEFAALGAAMIWAVSLLGLRSFQGRIAPLESNYFKTLFALTLLSVLVVAFQIDIPTQSTTWYWLLASGALGLAIGDTALFKTLSLVGAQLTTVTQLASPIFALLAGAIMLGEGVSVMQIMAITIVMGSVGCIVWIKSRDKSPERLPLRILATGLIWGLVSALFQGTSIVFTRYASQDDSFVVVTAIRLLGATPILIFLDRRLPTRFLLDLRARLNWDLGKLAIIFFFGTFVGVSLMTLGAKYSPAAIAATLTSTTPLWSIPIAALTGIEKPDYWSLPFVLSGIVGVALLFWFA